jgi:hypothetical protein
MMNKNQFLMNKRKKNILYIINMSSTTAASETVQYKVIKDGGATLYNSPEDHAHSKFRQGVTLRPVTLPVDNIFTGSQPDTTNFGWVRITEGDHSGKYLKSMKSGGERVITPLINFNISNLDGGAPVLSAGPTSASALNGWWRRVPQSEVVMAGGFEAFRKKVEGYTTAAKESVAAGNKGTSIRNLRLKKHLKKMNPAFTSPDNIKLFNSILSVKSQIIDLGDEWLRINAEHLRRLDCDETEITTACLEKCKLAAENFSQDVVDFLDIYLSLKNPSTAAALGGGKRKRKRKSKRRKTQKRKKSSKKSKRRNFKKSNRKSKKKRRNKTKRR